MSQKPLKIGLRQRERCGELLNLKGSEQMNLNGSDGLEASTITTDASTVAHRLSELGSARVVSEYQVHANIRGMSVCVYLSKEVLKVQVEGGRVVKHETLEEVVQTLRSVGEQADYERKLDTRQEAPSGGTPITRTRLLDVVERQQYRCALTGQDLTPATASLDHIIPIAKGGQHVLENVHMIRCDVNAAKGTMSVEDFVQMCCDVADYARRQPTKAAGSKVLQKN